MTIQSPPIQIDRQLSPERLQQLGIWDCPIWCKEASEFPWRYDEPETF